MFKFLKKNEELKLFSPAESEMIDLAQVPDKVFASKMMGEGVAFRLKDEFVCAPCDGTITLIPNTLHAFGIQAENGAEILVHIGLDTVALNGEGFTKLASQGDKIKQGTPIIQVDIKSLAKKGINLMTPMVVTNAADYEVNVMANQPQTHKESIVLRVKKR